MTARMQPTPRLFYIDNIRVVLICLVILTHLAITYGAYGSWFYNEVEGFSPETAVLTLVAALSQSFMMGFFFLVAAYFIPPSLERKGAGRFVRDRLVRLGIPLVFWVIFLGPMIRYYVAVRTEGYPGSLADWYSLGLTHPSIYGLGPLWFVLALLVFTLAYVLGRILFTGKGAEGEVHFPTLAVILATGILVGIVTFLVRIVTPIGDSWEFFDIQIPFFAQYIAFFLIGLYASKNKWFSRIPDRPGKTCAMLALLLAVCLPGILVGSGALSGMLDPLLGGFHWQSLIYSIWEQTFAVCMVTGMLWLFFTRFDHGGPLATPAANATYTVYIIHPLVIIPLTISMLAILLSPVSKFLFAAALAIPLCFLIAVLVRSIPGMDRVL